MRHRTIFSRTRSMASLLLFRSLFTGLPRVSRRVAARWFPSDERRAGKMAAHGGCASRTLDSLAILAIAHPLLTPDGETLIMRLLGTLKGTAMAEKRDIVIIGEAPGLPGRHAGRAAQQEDHGRRGGPGRRDMHQLRLHPHEIPPSPDQDPQGGRGDENARGPDRARSDWTGGGSSRAGRPSSTGSSRASSFCSKRARSRSSRGRPGWARARIVTVRTAEGERAYRSGQGHRRHGQPGGEPAVPQAGRPRPS